MPDIALAGEADRPRGGPLTGSVAAGLIGGLVGSWLMVEFQRRVWLPPAGSDGATSTSRLARRIAGPIAVDPPSDEQARSAGTAIHYALGAGLGVAYAVAARRDPRVAAGAGLPFGIATELVIDQAMVPALGLGNPFWKCPVASNARGLGAHLVFGLATEASRRLVLTLLRAAAPPAPGRGGR